MDESVFVVGAAGSDAGEVAGEAFGLAGAGAGAGVGVGRCFGDEPVDAGEGLAVGLRRKVGAFPTQTVYGGTRDPQLRLITCGGQFDDKDRRYLDNIIVYADRSA